MSLTWFTLSTLMGKVGTGMMVLFRVAIMPPGMIGRVRRFEVVDGKSFHDDTCQCLCKGGVVQKVAGHL